MGPEPPNAQSEGNVEPVKLWLIVTVWAPVCNESAMDATESTKTSARYRSLEALTPIKCKNSVFAKYCRNDLVLRIG